MVASTRCGSAISALSVISSCSRSAGTPYRRSSSSIWSAMSPACRSRTLTLTAARTGRPAARQRGELGDHLVEHPAGQQPHHRGLLGDPDQLLRADQAAVRVLPAQQRLDADHLAGRDGDLRLVEERDPVVGAVVLQRAAQVGEQGQPVGRVVVGVGAVDRDLVAALLRVVHRGLGLAQQRGAVAAVLGCSAMPIDALTSTGSPSSVNGRFSASARWPAMRRAPAGAVDPGGEHGELVAAEPDHQIVRRYDARPAGAPTSTSSRSPTACPSASLTCGTGRGRAAAGRVPLGPVQAAAEPRSVDRGLQGAAVRQPGQRVDAGGPLVLARPTGPSGAPRAGRAAPAVRAPARPAPPPARPGRAAAARRWRAARRPSRCGRRGGAPVGDPARDGGGEPVPGDDPGGRRGDGEQRVVPARLGRRTAARPARRRRRRRPARRRAGRRRCSVRRPAGASARPATATATTCTASAGTRPQASAMRR